MTLRTSSRLSAELEALVTRIIGCAIEVHRRLGPGLTEGLYEDALTIELELAGLRFERQRRVTVEYRGRPLRSQIIDLVVDDRVVLEIKAVGSLAPIHRAQLLSYVRCAKLPIGLLINFNGETIKGNLARVVN
jgi:GxxExxY protein